MTRTTTFNPTWASPPGKTVAEMLEKRRISAADLAALMGRTLTDVAALIDGATAITQEDANRLESVLGGSATFWLERETQYRSQLQRLAAETATNGDLLWLSEIPITDMQKFGWIPVQKVRERQLEVCLDFFDVSSVKDWKIKYEKIAQVVNFRTSLTIESKSGSTAAWLRKGEIEAHRIQCAPWDSEKFSACLPDLRRLTRKKDPSAFLPELVRQCAGCGVAIVVVRAPSGCRASGATWFIDSQKAVLLLSFRYLSDDHFWFTFFHEAGHLILHSTNALFIEGEDLVSTQEEEEANQFSASTLIPPSFVSAMLALRSNTYEIARFAQKIGVSPGIVVGQLQHHGRLTRRQMNGLKRRFSWI